ncbi:DUF3810 domain-containing protein [Romboutsia ilealis]|uniref:DUF3810 domain-containing protein n=1 Tax=Romboutsia faecis TaxID=2764597 RepID=A0ABR7JP78_9FIRM|nr:DUF3810 domain-containing protein [Romboutsia faecis]MBC5996577.1 DUF3810 domain-containing protein [Romboutsia faecis]MRN24102.1 DUF3810 domain-containing protein [Romboutsia ilealis]
MRKNKIIIFMLFPLSLLLNFLASKFPYFIETYYTQGINKITVQLLSKISSIFPFSIYEFAIYSVIIISIYYIIYSLYLLFKNKYKFKIHIVNSIINILSIFSITYSLFIILWGLNYNKLPLETILIDKYNKENNKSITKVEYNNEDLIELYKYLVDKTNETRKLVLEDNNNIMKLNSDYKDVIKRAHTGFDNISNIMPNLDGYYGNAKYILSSRLMCYTGITGIYFPFTGEANINKATPDFSIPSTTLHEMAHQRGYASEDEANFIAYLASINHSDVDFIYSGYRLALSHTSNALRNVDFESYKELSRNLSDDVINDIKSNNKFWSKYEGEINDLSDSFNNSYLKANGVKEGTESYGKMVNLLLTYYTLNK